MPKASPLGGTVIPIPTNSSQQLKLRATIVGLPLARGSDVRLHQAKQTPEASEACVQANASGAGKRLEFKIMDPASRAEALERWGYASVYEAVDAGNMDALKFLLARRASPAERVNGESPLLLAVRKRAVDAIKLLHAHGAGINQTGPNESPLVCAIKSGDFEIVKLLLDLGSYANAQDKSGYSLLMLAARCGGEKIVRLLISKGAEVNGRDKGGSSALFEAVCGGSLEVVRELVRAGANLYARARASVEIGSYILPASGSFGGVSLSLGTSSLRDEEPKHPAWFSVAKATNNQASLPPTPPLEKGRVVGQGGSICAGKGSESICAGGEEDNSGEAEGGEAAYILPASGSLGGVSLSLGTSSLRDEEPKHPVELGGKVSAELMTPLMVAEALVAAGKAGGDMQKIVRYLRESGSDADKLDEDGDTPLLRAIRCKDFDEAQRLVLRGADCKARDAKGWTPLHLVAKVGEEPSLDPEVARRYFNPPIPKSLGSNSLTHLLLNHGGSVTARNAYGATPLIVAAQNGHRAVVESLLKCFFDAGRWGQSLVDKRDNDGCSALMYAAKNGYVEVVRLLLSNRAQVDLRNERARAPHAVIRVNKINSVRKLRARTARVETSGEVGWTALMYAAKNGHLGVVKLLLEHKADVNACDSFGRSVLMHAVWGRDCNPATLKLLLSRGADVNKEVIPTRTADCERTLPFSRYAEMESSCNQRARFPSLGGRDVHTCKASVRVDGSETFIKRDLEGSSVLLFAAVGGKSDIIEYLLQFLPVDDRNKYWFTALMVSSQRGNLKLTRFLVERGADVNLKEEFGRSALYFAVEGGHFKVAELLLKSGARVNVTDEYTGKTMLDVARENGREDLVELLRKHGATK